MHFAMLGHRIPELSKSVHSHLENLEFEFVNKTENVFLFLSTYLFQAFFKLSGIRPSKNLFFCSIKKCGSVIKGTLFIFAKLDACLRKNGDFFSK